VPHLPGDKAGQAFFIMAKGFVEASSLGEQIQLFFDMEQLHLEIAHMRQAAKSLLDPAAERICCRFANERLKQFQQSQQPARIYPQLMDGAFGCFCAASPQAFAVIFPLLFQQTPKMFAWQFLCPRTFGIGFRQCNHNLFLAVRSPCPDSVLKNQSDQYPSPSGEWGQVVVP
jgi:hypothetical protein